MRIVNLTAKRGAKVRALGIEDASIRGSSPRCESACPPASPPHARCKTLNVRGSSGRSKRFSHSNARAPGANFGTTRNSFYGATTAITSNLELSRILQTFLFHIILLRFTSVFKASKAQRRRDYRRVADAIPGARSREAEPAARSHLCRAIDRRCANR